MLNKLLIIKEGDLNFNAPTYIVQSEFENCHEEHFIQVITLYKGNNGLDFKEQNFLN